MLCPLRYLQVEWEVRRGTPRVFNNENIKGSHCKVPLQDNSSDCGLYLLQYVESFLQVHTHPNESRELIVLLKHILVSGKQIGHHALCQRVCSSSETHFSFLSRVSNHFFPVQNPIVHFDLPLRLERWFPRQQVRRKRAELRELVLELYQKQVGGAIQSS